MPTNKSQAVLVLSTASGAPAAKRIAQTLVETNLAACVNVIGPIHSIYRWQGSVTTDSEHLLLIKTRASLYPLLERKLKEIHHYEVPEIVAIKFFEGSQDYIRWLLEATSLPNKPLRKTKQADKAKARRQP